MAKTPGSGNKETIKPPSKKALADASQELKKQHPSGGRTLADQSVAVKQGLGHEKAARNSAPPPKKTK